MNDTLNMLLVFIGGLALGVLFFGGLWLTTKKAVGSTKPAIILLASFISRVVIVLLGFYLLGAGNWQRMLLALLGFIVARFMVIYFTKAKSAIKEKEVNIEA